MKTHDPELQQIKNLLRNNPKGMKISKIARELEMNRNAAAKFLEILLMTGQVEMFEHGMSKIFLAKPVFLRCWNLQDLPCF
jgi:DNA-binding IclR family transcriptional regulator